MSAAANVVSSGRRGLRPPPSTRGAHVQTVKTRHVNVGVSSPVIARWRSVDNVATFMPDYEVQLVNI